MYRTYRFAISNQTDDAEFASIGGFRGADVALLQEYFPECDFWAETTEFGACYPLTHPQALVFYNHLVEYAKVEIPSTEPYIIGYTFGSIPTTRSPLELFNYLIPFFEKALEIDDPKGQIQIRKFDQRPLA